MKADRRRALVLGLGNPLAGDDGFGPAVIENLRGAPPEGADLEDGGTDLLAWIEDFAAYELVVLVDALLAPEAPAREVVVLDEEQLAGYPDSSPSVHQMSPLLALRLFRRLYPEARTRIVLVALRTPEIRFDTPPSLTDRGRTDVNSIISAYWLKNEGLGGA